MNLTRRSFFRALGGLAAAAAAGASFGRSLRKPKTQHLGRGSQLRFAQDHPLNGYDGTVISGADTLDELGFSGIENGQATTFSIGDRRLPSFSFANPGGGNHICVCPGGITKRYARGVQTGRHCEVQQSGPGPWETIWEYEFPL